MLCVVLEEFATELQYRLDGLAFPLIVTSSADVGRPVYLMGDVDATMATANPFAL